MGVEYKHFFVVSDRTWTGSLGTLRQVHAVLERWQLVAGPPEVLSLDRQQPEKLGCVMDELSESDGLNFAALYPMVEGAPSIAKLLGPSYHGVEPSERYIQRLVVVAGIDYRVHESSEQYYFEIGRGSFRDGEVLQATEATYPLPFDRSFPGADAEPPVVTVHQEGEPELGDGFSGFWRGALCLDCGKDLPEFCDKRHEIPDSQFSGEVADAFGASLFQLGHIY